jgi:hydroxyethylthiazole kinase
MHELKKNPDIILKEVRLLRPLVHQITNSVSSHIQANVTAILGGCPVMSCLMDEAAEIAEKSDALLVNIGTPHRDTYDVISESMRIAERRRIPAVLDIVGYGFTDFRRRLAESLLERFNFSVIKGNRGEISSLAGKGPGPKGVNALGHSGDDMASITETLAKRYNCVVFCTGDKDCLSDGTYSASFSGGSPMTGILSGMGCALGSVTALFSAAAGPFDASFASLCSFRAAGEAAFKTARCPASFYAAFVDALFMLSEHGFGYWGNFIDER